MPPAPENLLFIVPVPNLIVPYDVPSANAWRWGLIRWLPPLDELLWHILLLFRHGLMQPCLDMLLLRLIHRLIPRILVCKPRVVNMWPWHAIPNSRSPLYDCRRWLWGRI